MKKLFHNLATFLIVAVMLVTHNVVQAGPAPYTNINTAITPPAFPGAEGFGANTLGGRGGEIFEVVNLNDSGSGSLRACIDAIGARTCVFRTGGLIQLQSSLSIRNPYITIAGQTAPGGGITIKGEISPQTHDIVIRYISIRRGPGGSNHAIQIAKNGTELYNIIVDHVSLSWGTDSIIETWYRAKDVTFSWLIVSEGLDCSTHPKGCHSKGLMIGGYQGSESGGKGSENISVLNNLMAHNGERNPLMQLCGIAQVIGNTTYDPMYTFSHQQLNCVSGESYVNWINNYHKRGPSSTSSTDLKIIPSDDGDCGEGKAYSSGNTNSTGGWSQGFSGSCAGRTDIFVTVPAPAPVVVSMSAIDSYNKVLAGAGNSQGVDCGGNWYNRRDSIDARVVNEVKTSTGHIIDDPSEVGGWITPAAGTACTDTDRDGMPDTWEIKYGLNPNNNPDAKVDADGDGYTNVEEYINATVPTGGTVNPISLVATGITASDKTYNGATTATLGFSGTTLVGVVPGDDVTLATGSASAIFSDKNVGIDKTVTTSGLALTGADAYKYSLTQPTGLTADITAKGLTVTADNQSKAVGQPDPVFTFASSGFVGADTFVTNPTCGVDDAHNVPGVYDIVCRGGNAGANYTISSYVKGILTVSVIDVPGQELVLPHDGEVLHYNRPTFDWVDYPGAISYQIQVSKDIAFTQLIQNVSLRTAISAYTPTTNLTANTTLYWRVRARLTQSYSLWSAIHSFHTGNPPSVPTLASPANGALLAGPSPLFNWNNSTIPAGATFDHYQIQIATNNTFTTIVHDLNIAGITNSQDGTAVLNPGTTYYWRVRSWNTAGDYSVWSIVRNVKIKFNPPTLSLPANGATGVSLLPTFTWEAAIGATNYTLQVSKVNTFLPLVLNKTVAVPTYTATTNLSAATTYYWRVRVNGLYGPSVWSTVFSFTTP